MSTTLYRKYRPQKFSEIIGQTHIVQTLSNAIKNNRVGQAYLFTGPRGTGKTTLARLFAKAVNCEKRDGFEPCQKCAICKNISDGRSLDIIEIDAASNTGVDNIRELRETVKLPPTQAKYKVYIIDEVHMLSAGAFNALLKTLEEPPAHVIFILATTEIHKVPETIISRCQRFDFYMLSLEQIVRKLSSIAKSEKVEIEKDALEMIAIAAEGGMRDAESLLGQIIALEDKNITAKEVADMLGTARHESVEKMSHCVLHGRTQEALELARKLSEEGINFDVFDKSLLNYLRQMMIISVSPDLSGLFSLELTGEQLKNIKAEAAVHSPVEILNVIEIIIDCQQKIRSSFIPSLPLEMAIVKSTMEQTTNNAQQTIKQDVNLSIPSEKVIKAEKVVRDEKTAKSDPQIINDNLPGKKMAVNNLTIETITDNWPNIAKATQPSNHSLMAFLSNCQPVKIENGTVIVATKYNLYKDKLNEKNNRLTIEAVMAKILNSSLRVKFVTEEEAGVKIYPVKYPDSRVSAHSGEFNRVNSQLTTNNKQQKGSENGSLLDDAMKLMGGKIVDD